MQRRTFLNWTIAATAAAAARRGLGAQLPGASSAIVPPAVNVRRVLLITKCHLDVGFTATQAKVMQRYFKEYFPAAMQTAANLRERGPDHYTWTTGSWLLYEYLEQATPAERKVIEAAIEAQDLSWHALPFSWQTEMLDRSMIEGGLGFSAALDRRFGRRTIGAKMTDVPGHTRGIVAPLQAAGVRLLDVGVNAASTPPEVPELFLWKDSAGSSVCVLYHHHDYGSVLAIPGTDVAVAVVVRNDNSGPHTPAEIAALYAGLRQQFPGAAVHASTLNEAAMVIDGVRDRLPVVTAEIGDTWIYGVASDPEKVSTFRAATRLRQQWLQQHRMAPGDATDLALLRRLLLAAEHTWGTDTKSYLDNDHYLAKDLARVLETKGYRTMEESWAEKRADVRQGFAMLPPALREEAERVLQPQPVALPSTAGMRQHQTGDPLQTKHFDLAIDPATGGITRLRKRSSGHEFASPQHPWAMFTYQTLSSSTFAAYLERYVKSKEDWAPRDFGKPGVERFGASDRSWHPRLVACWTSASPIEDRVLLQLAVEDAEALAEGTTAWPKQIVLDLRCPASKPEIQLQLTLCDKQANRMPEAMWLSFQPQTSGEPAPVFDKAGETIHAEEVVRGGGRGMHAVSGAVRYPDSRHPLTIHALDTALVAVGERSPLNFSLEQPNLEGGIHYGLFNNAWGTNYPQWCGGSWSYRFRVEL